MVKMAETAPKNPAEEAAQKAIDSVFNCIREGKSFRLEAGAGAGKTYTLIKALNFIIDERGDKLLRQHQQVACITYTNVAKDEIESRTDGHPAVFASTIHSFCWSLIRGFQAFLREKLSEMDVWKPLLEEIDGVGSRRIDYELGHRRAKPDEPYVSLHHDDVISLTICLLEMKKFRNLLAAQFPILFIDEYQDTNNDFAEAILQFFIEADEGPLIGLFGDSWQKIYGNGSGLIEHENLTFIGKEANFRSVKTIVDVLNRIRPELPQEVVDPLSVGSVQVFHSNTWTGTRRTGSHWAGDLPTEEVDRYSETLIKQLETEGWDFSPERTKILMLTHRALAAKQKFTKLANIFPYNDAYVKKENPFIAFFADLLEPVCEAYQSKHFGEMFSYLGRNSLTIKKLDDKRAWAEAMDKLLELRETGTIGQVLDHLQETQRPRLPDNLTSTSTKLGHAPEEEIEQTPLLKQLKNMRDIPYQEMVSLTGFINEHTPFSTKHGVKGAEFESVLVILGRGWNQYNWDDFLKLDPGSIPNVREEFYERNRNLFYVICSRPKQRLALIFTQKLSADSMSRLSDWFGEEAIHALT